MKARKIVLASACLVLLVIAVIQTVTSRIDPVKIISVKEEIDEIKVERPEGNFSLKKNGEDWFVQDKYVGNFNVCQDLADALREVKILGKVAKSDKEEILAKYDLNKDKVYTVSVLHEGKVLRTYSVGKATSTNSQVYMRIDGGNDVCMAAGKIQNDLSKSINDFRSKVILNLNKDDIVSVTVKPAAAEEWTITRSAQGTDWTISGAGIKADAVLDSEITSGWFGGCANLAASDWLSDNENIAAPKLLDAEIKTSNKTIRLSFFSEQDEEGSDIYWGTCSEMPYSFKLAKYSVQKFQKNPEDFIK